VTQGPDLNVHSESVPRWVGTYAERVISARGHPVRLKRVFARSSVPMVMLDKERRYIEVNTPARLALRLNLAELRRRRIDDLTPPHLWPVMDAAWQRLMETGCMAGPYVVASPDGGRFEMACYALANALPGLHLIAFAPAEWPDGELVSDGDRLGSEPVSPLTTRELEVLELAAEGRNGPMIARELVLSGATVRTHFEHIYAKLRVRDRPGAVAKAMRLGLIA
jgi:DNA-binding CsgD family transcriptional regulator